MQRDESMTTMADRGVPFSMAWTGRPPRHGRSRPDVCPGQNMVRAYGARRDIKPGRDVGPSDREVRPFP